MTGFVLSARDVEALAAGVGDAGLRDAIRGVLEPGCARYYISGREETICSSVRINAGVLLSLGPLGPDLECVRECVRACGLPCVYLYSRRGGECP